MPAGPVKPLPRLDPAAVSHPEFETECVEFFAELVEIFGVPWSVGQIYGVLFASPQPLSFSDIVERLEISKGSASQGLQLLRSLGAVKVAPGAEPRREYFEPELGLRKLLGGVLRERVEPMLRAGGSRMARLHQLAETSDEEGEFYFDRVKQLETWRRQMTLILPVLRTLLSARPR